MVLQVLADAGQMMRAGAEVRKLGGVANAREHQQLRRGDRARRQDDLAARRAPHGGNCRAAIIFDPGAQPVLDQHPRHLRLGADLQVLAAANWLQIGVGGAVATAENLVGLDEAGPFLGSPVEIVVGRQAGGDRRLDEFLRQRMAASEIGRMQRTVAAAILDRRRFRWSRCAGNRAGHPHRTSRHCRARPSCHSRWLGHAYRRGRRARCCRR